MGTEVSQPADFFAGKRILVTGGTGTIGSSIVRRLLELNPAAIRIFSRDEHKQFLLQQELLEFPNLRFLVGDIRDKDRLLRAMEGVDVVFHAAALKQVPMCEFNPFEAVMTNVTGAQNLVDCALRNQVDRVVGISTDKVVNPVNVMGATKLLAEKVLTSAILYKGERPTVFSAVRFGNVLGSRGSVLPLLWMQMCLGRPITITDPGMRRFVMSVCQTTDLVFRAAAVAQGGEVFILKMPVVRLEDLISALVEEFASRTNKSPSQIERTVIGIRPGEKIDEILMTEEEARYALETEDMFIIPPHPNISYPVKWEHHYPGSWKSEQSAYDSRGTAPMTREGVQKTVHELVHKWPVEFPSNAEERLLSY